MNTHVKVLGVLFLVLSGLGVLMAGLVMVGVGAGLLATGSDPDSAAAIPFIGMAGGIAIFAMLVTSLPGIVTGIGLLKFRPWARILGIVLCAISLFGFPVFTIFGAYGLWVLLNKESERLFNPIQTTTVA